MSFVRSVAVLIGKDLRSEWRTKEVLSSTLTFAVLALTVINFGFEPGNNPVDGGCDNRIADCLTCLFYAGICSFKIVFQNLQVQLGRFQCIFGGVIL